MFPKIPLPLDLLFSLGVFSGMTILLNYSFGLYELAELYRTNTKPSEGVIQRGKFCNGSLSKDSRGSFKGATIAFLETGLYIATPFSSFPILDILTPTLLIPWNEISKYKIIADKRYCFHLGNPMISILTLGIEDVRELESLSGIQISDRLNDN